MNALFSSGDGDCSDDRDHEQCARKLERRDLVGEERATDRADSAEIVIDVVEHGKVRLRATRATIAPAESSANIADCRLRGSTCPLLSRGGVASGPSNMMTNKKRTMMAPA